MPPTIPDSSPVTGPSVSATNTTATTTKFTFVPASSAIPLSVVWNSSARASPAMTSDDFHFTANGGVVGFSSGSAVAGRGGHQHDQHFLQAREVHRRAHRDHW